MEERRDTVAQGHGDTNDKALFQISSTK
jgi:hypothetical protein